MQRGATVVDGGSRTERSRRLVGRGASFTLLRNTFLHE